MRLALAPILAVLPLAAQQSPMDFLNHNRPVPDAHNCYPYKGQWKDRIDRALRTPFPVAIEQDIAWARGEPVVSHDAKTTGGELPLRTHFFERVRPIVEKALAENDRARWPIIVLHFDFKSVQPELLQAVWDLLGEYQGWITTAEKTADPSRLSPFDPKPLLVLTEDADAQEEVFFKQVPVGGRLRVFGSAHTATLQAANRAEREHLQATLPPDRLLTQPATNYRRWWNNSWFVVEEGGQHKAGDWTPDDDRRLRALVDHAHKLGYWIRFFTLDGFAPGEDKGWGDTYNFGSREAVMLRWKAAVAAGVNLIASDQYEELAAVIR
ncbi:MAG TPA: hypothetical protein VMS37_26650 [Verrucomicrobiae bacterium]|nr:hypothetical protein [Verrucomicrobiae bacterium]